MMSIQNRPVILLVAEAVTLAHFARIAALAKFLDPAVYDVVIASDPRYLNLEISLDRKFYPVYSISAAEFAQALAQGKPLYNVETLTRYVIDDLALLDKVKPDLVIGDFRLSLAVSAPLCKIPYAAVVNAYWSPYANIVYPVPDLPMTRMLGVSWAQKMFNIFRPMAFALHARPLNRVRRHFGLQSLGADIRDTYTWGDYTLYADSSEVIPINNLPTHHHYLGPILWSTHYPLPNWWRNLPSNKPVIFMTLGSSGQANLLPLALSSLSRMPVTVIAATAGKMSLSAVPANAYITEYLPIDIAIRHAKLVICNGGSLTTYQSLSSGIPVIGLCSNMDQMLNMGAVERLGAGLMFRAAKVTSDNLLAAVNLMLQDFTYTQSARNIRRTLLHYNTGQRFQAIVRQILHLDE